MSNKLSKFCKFINKWDLREFRNIFLIIWYFGKGLTCFVGQRKSKKWLKKGTRRIFIRIHKVNFQHIKIYFHKETKHIFFLCELFILLMNPRENLFLIWWRLKSKDGRALYTILNVQEEVLTWRRLSTLMDLIKTLIVFFNEITYCSTTMTTKS